MVGWRRWAALFSVVAIVVGACTQGTAPPTGGSPGASATPSASGSATPSATASGQPSPSGAPGSPGPLPDPADVAGAVVAATSDEERTAAILDVLRAVAIGVYTADGAPIVHGAERTAVDFFLYSYLVYDQLSRAEAHCGGRFGSSAPDAFSIEAIDTAPYLMPDYEEVHFPSRDEGITISGWFVPVLPPDVGPAVEAPTVIVVHGLSSCKREPLNLLIAGMLHGTGSTPS